VDSDERAGSLVAKERVEGRECLAIAGELGVTMSLTVSPT
jgi:hypothetical protein